MTWSSRRWRRGLRSSSCREARSRLPRGLAAPLPADLPPTRPTGLAPPAVEDLRDVACDVIRRAFPRLTVEPRDLADVRRIGARVLLCRFVHTGPGSVRHYLYQNRMTLN